MAKHQDDDPAQIGRDQASEIARQASTPGPEDFTLHEALPAGRVIFGDFSSEPCWFIEAPRKSSRGTQFGAGRMIVVSRRTGRVLYDG